MSVPGATFSFSGHETFPFRYPWMKKGYDAVVADGGAFLQDDAITTLGVGKNMVRSIRHWCLAAGVIEEDRGTSARPTGSMKTTPLGDALFGPDGFDPYLEDPATLWILHWQLATNLNRATSWFWAFNHFHEAEFSREALGTSLFKWSQTLPGKKVAESSVRRDIETFLRTYIPPRKMKSEFPEETLDCPLVELGLIYSVADAGQTYAFNRGLQENLPDGVLLFAVARFWDQFSPQTETLAIPDLSRQLGSPGQVFKIDEASLVLRFEQIEEWSEGRLSYRETAGLRQLYRRSKFDPQSVLGIAYGSTLVPTGGLFA